jgi:hypothetical protein
MKKYMVIISGVEGQDAFFTDDYSAASNTRMDAECGLGYYAEIYERQEVDGEMQYVFLEA